MKREWMVLLGVGLLALMYLVTGRAGRVPDAAAYPGPVETVTATATVWIVPTDRVTITPIPAAVERVWLPLVGGDE